MKERERMIFLIEELVRIGRYDLAQAIYIRVKDWLHSDPLPPEQVI